MRSQLGTEWGLGRVGCEPRKGQGSAYVDVHVGSVVTIGIEWGLERVGYEPRGGQGSAYVDVHVGTVVTTRD